MVGAGADGASGAVTVIGELETWVVDPLLSVAVMMIAKDPALVYECVSDLAKPESTSGADPSPQLTLREEMVPSRSVAEKFTVTVWLVSTWLAVRLARLTLGG